MRENVAFFPTLQIEPGARRQEFEAGFRQGSTILARQHGVELVTQRMQMQHIGGGISQLRFRL